MSQKYVIIGSVTDQEVADIYTKMTGYEVRVDDREYRVVDDPVNYGYSYDYPSIEHVLVEHPDAIFLN